MAGTAARLELEWVLTITGIRIKETKNVRIWDELEEARKSGEAR
ncbi:MULTISPECIES: hypothetical protein [Myxococcus]|nr:MULTISPECIES: hypothetical protein [Myxococcus]WAM23480.1 hypothetical protein OZ403_23250 [Myxococcus sp. NMCA1]